MPKERPVITFLSDFGDNFALSQVELVVNSENPDARFIVLSNEVTPFSTLEGSFLLAKSYKFSPRGSIHMAVVDPGVGSERKGLVVKSQNHWFVGPDNGLLYPAAKDDGIENVYAIDSDKVNLTGLSTFHGRDVFAPVAARLSKGEDPLSFAKKISEEEIVPYDFEPNRVAHVDRFGNVKLTSIPGELVVGDRLEVGLPRGRKITLPYQRTFADVPYGSLFAYRGSHGTLELAQNLGSAAQTLPVSVGDRLEIAML